ncbi:DoxX family protein [Winslowiella iniecta]|uniref:DoxX n=1 Tax=Winslowiella iniecta TaxID=1560201 RepID=A0A0L7T1N9_9GAMM|nr:DoxX family protein [Winslowiella iniecta]KOC89248.1 DoxX [Winslowiella iniecta]KOC94817.1 DoxX [Winslowiella iniecta]
MFSAINNGFTRIFDHPDFGKLLLRLTFGILLLFHGAAKIQHGVGWIASMLAAHGLPGFIAYGAWIGEIVAPVMVIIGLMTRPAAFVIAVNMVVATLLVKTGAFWSRTDVGAWALETEALYFFGGVIIMLLGAGKYTLIRNPRLQ